MNSSYDIGYSDGIRGGNPFYRPGKRTVGGASYVAYNAGFSAGSDAYNAANRDRFYTENPRAWEQACVREARRLRTELRDVQAEFE